MSEHTEQCAFVEWLRWKHIPHYAIPNGGSRNLIEAARLKAEGVSAGVPDLCIPVPAGKAHGLYIEIKYGKNKTTNAQKEWISTLVKSGYACAVCYSADAAIKVTEEYLMNNSQKFKKRNMKLQGVGNG